MITLPVLRHSIKDRYTILPNDSLRDERLSLRDVGLLAYMLSMPDEWQFSVAGLSAVIRNDGTSSIKAGVKVLQQTHYLTISRERQEGGKLGSVIWTISDVPQTEVRDDEPQVDFPHMGKPQVENRTQRKNLNKKVNISSCADDRFEEFWSVYPRKVGKKNARKAFAKVKVSDVDRLLASLEIQKRAWSDPQFIPYPQTWLNGERWNDECQPEKKELEQPKFEQYVGADGKTRNRRVKT